jgi:hypothetical protein
VINVLPSVQVPLLEKVLMKVEVLKARGNSIEFVPVSIMWRIGEELDDQPLT